MSLRKYLTVIKTNWQRSLTYRTTVIGYRVGEIAELLIMIAMWATIFQGQEFVRGFTYNQMVTYLLVGNIVQSAVRNWLYQVVARDIADGSLSYYLVRPMPYISAMMAREVGRTMFAAILSVGSVFVVSIFFYSNISLDISLLSFLLVIPTLLLALVTELLLSYLIGLFAFWTVEVDGVFTTIERLKLFFSGGYFPLNLLPATLATLSYFLPFAYSFYVPTLYFIGKIDDSYIVRGWGVQIVWIALLYLIISVVWKRGLRRYEGTGM